jgi:hypothetical protein
LESIPENERKIHIAAADKLTQLLKAKGQREKFVATHHLLIGGVRHYVKRVQNHWETATGETFYCGFAEPIKK